MEDRIKEISKRRSLTINTMGCPMGEHNRLIFDNHALNDMGYLLSQIKQARLDGMKECLEIAQAFKRLELRKDVWEERMVKWCNGYKSAITDTTRAIEAAMEANDD